MIASFGGKSDLQDKTTKKWSGNNRSFSFYTDTAAFYR
jgi:hypothetical protein